MYVRLERERERERYIYTCYTGTHTHSHINTHIYAQVWMNCALVVPIKISGATLVVISILTMRKMGTMVGEIKKRPEVTPCQKLVWVALVLVTVANQVFSASVLQAVEIFIWGCLLSNLGYFSLIFYQSLNRTFNALSIVPQRETRTNATETNTQQHISRSVEGRRVTASMKQVKRKIQVNMVVGVVVCTTLASVCCILLNPIWQQQDQQQHGQELKCTFLPSFLSSFVLYFLPSIVPSFIVWRLSLLS